VLALAAIFAMGGYDLNAGDFISRGVEGDDESHAKSITWRRHAMGSQPSRISPALDKLTGLPGKNTC